MTKTNNPQQSTLPDVFIGLPMWQHPDWPATWFGGRSNEQLRRYASQLNSIEGNTSFYSLPAMSTLEQWADSVPDGFRFTFKFHQSISHQAQLHHCESLIDEQLALMTKLGGQLGLMLLQLPPGFGPEKLTRLTRFLSYLPDEINVAVEVRHPAFFDKGAQEKQFNQLLLHHGANRMIMDTRALFSGPADSALTAEVRTKKPRVPVNVIATGDNPVVRFVGNNSAQDNERCLLPWIKKVHQWRCERRTPYLFFHRPDNKDAPWLADLFINRYNASYPEHKLRELQFPAVTDQSALF